MNEKEVKHKCFGCLKTHTDKAYRWKSRILVDGGKKIWWCGSCVDCGGCRKIHFNDTGRTLIIGNGAERIEMCGRWYQSPSPSIKKKMENLSPEEVLSGVHLGLPQTYKGQSNDHSFEKKAAVKELKKSL